MSTRTDVLAPEFIEVLKTLQDDVPAFSGKRAKKIVMEELKLDEAQFDKTFKNFSAEPLAAASLGQVHTAVYKGRKVAIKVQRAKLKEVRESEERRTAGRRAGPKRQLVLYLTDPFLASLATPLLVAAL